MINIIFIIIGLMCLCMSMFITCKLLLKKEKTRHVHKNKIIDHTMDVYPIFKTECHNYHHSLIIKCVTMIALIFIGFNIGLHIEQYRAFNKVNINDVNSKYYSSALLVDGEIVPIETINLNDSTNIENTKENEGLLNATSFDMLNIKQNIDAVDSYGNTHSDSFVFYGQNSYVKFMLNAKYSSLEFNLSIENTADMNQEGTLMVTADDNIIYISPIMTKTNAPMDISIPINNCHTLSIEYNTNGKNSCIISDTILYE